MSKTLYDKLWNSHLVHSYENGLSILYVDRHLIHEVTSPQAFEAIKIANRELWRKEANLVVADHNVPTTDRSSGIKDLVSRIQVETLDSNVKKYGLTYFDMNDQRQGIVHVIGPEQGATLPGMTVVCGDSHTSTHGAFACLAHGIGTSEVEHVLATQTILVKKSKSMLINISGELLPGVTSKDLILSVIGLIGTDGGTGYVIEFSGSAISSLSVESRMTICNMTIEAGAKAGLIAVDEKTIEYVQNRPYAPSNSDWDDAVNYWRTLKSDDNAMFDKKITLNASNIIPQVTWGTSPEMVVPIDSIVPDPSLEKNFSKKDSYEKALSYMNLKPNTPMKEIYIDKVFIGSCTNSRIEDLRQAADVIKGKKLAKNIKLALVVPGSGLVKKQAEKEGLDEIFIEAGFEWREPGCSMCLAMNDDRLNPGERCASTSNRNFEGRQGFGGRTHLVSPAMAAAAGITGHLVDFREIL